MPMLAAITADLGESIALLALINRGETTEVVDFGSPFSGA
jgi:hypothetical protein